MQPIEIYTSPLCGFCHAAKRLLNAKGASFADLVKLKGKKSILVFIKECKRLIKIIPETKWLC